MPTGPKGQKRPADVISNAVKFMRIATGEEEDPIGYDGKDSAAKALGAKGGRKRAENMLPQRRIAMNGLRVIAPNGKVVTNQMVKDIRD
jgi:hypothetical protein